jgi:hypothetical protein
MEKLISGCEHRWRYFVDVPSRSVRVKECERCGRRGVVPMELAPMPRVRHGEAQRLTA